MSLEKAVVVLDVRCVLLSLKAWDTRGKGFVGDNGQISVPGSALRLAILGGFY